MHQAAPNGSFPLSRSESEDAKTHLSVSDIPNTEADETSSLMSKSSVSGAGDVEENGERCDSTAHDPHHLDIRGLALLPKIEFWELFILLGLLTGIGLMTIKYVPFIVFCASHILIGTTVILETMYVTFDFSALRPLTRPRHKLCGVITIAALLRDGYKDVN